MPDALIRKLDHSGFLTEADRDTLRALPLRGRDVAARQDLIRQGERPETVKLVLEGFAYRYKLLPGGRRQILALMLPGDVCDMHAAILGEMDHSIGTLTPCRIVDIPHAVVFDLEDGHPRIRRALWWATLVGVPLTVTALSRVAVQEDSSGHLMSPRGADSIRGLQPPARRGLYARTRAPARTRLLKPCRLRRAT